MAVVSINLIGPGKVNCFRPIEQQQTRALPLMLQVSSEDGCCAVKSRSSFWDQAMKSHATLQPMSVAYVLQGHQGLQKSCGYEAPEGKSQLPIFSI